MFGWYVYTIKEHFLTLFAYVEFLLSSYINVALQWGKSKGGASADCLHGFCAHGLWNQPSVMKWRKPGPKTKIDTNQ